MALVLARLSQLSSSEVRSCKFTALEMESATQRRGELHVTAAGVPASAAFPHRNQLTLQQGRLGRPFQVQREIKHWDRNMGCPSLGFLRRSKVEVD